MPLYAVLIAASLWLSLESHMKPILALSATAGLALATFVLGGLLFAPFHQHYVALFSSIDEVQAPTVPEEWLLHLGGLLLLVGLGVSWLAIQRRGHLMSVSPTRQYLLTAGAVAASVALVLYVTQRLDELPMNGIGPIVVAGAAVVLAGWYVASRSRPEGVVYLGGGIVLVSLFAIAWSGWGVLAAGIGIAILGVVLWIWPDRTEYRFAGLLIAAAGCAVAGLELVYVVDDLFSDPVYYRMNSMFKIYNEIWMLLAIAGAALCGRIFSAAFGDDPDPLPEQIRPGSCTDDYCEDTHPGSKNPHGNSVGYRGLVRHSAWTRVPRTGHRTASRPALRQSSGPA